MGAEAMNHKVEVASDMFKMLDPDSFGNVELQQLHVALQAGGISEQVIRAMLGSFDATAEHISFMAVLQYLPLFAEAHANARHGDGFF
jgi:Ca2+-binding EF-hand superfamily protein